MGRSGAVLGIIGLILAAGSIGFTFIVWNGQNTSNSDLKAELDDLIDDLNNLTDELNFLTDEFNNFTRTTVVGKWNALYDNQDYEPYNLTNNWLYEYRGNSLNNTNYIAVSNNNTRITLLKSGWYRIHLSVLLKNINASFLYKTSILKDGATEFVLDRLQTGATFNEYYHHVDSSAFVYSNGTNYIEINGYTDWDDYFSPHLSPHYNQLTIEYVAQ